MTNNTERFDAIVEGDIKDFLAKMAQVDRAIRQAATGASVNVQANTAAFAAQMQLVMNQIQNVNNSNPNVNVQASIAAAIAQLQLVQAQANNIDNNINTVHVKANISEAMAELQRVRKQAEDLAYSDVDVHVEVEAERALERFERIQNRIKRLETMQPTVEVNTDLREAMRELALVERELQMLTQRNHDLHVVADVTAALGQLRLVENVARKLETDTTYVDIKTDTASALAEMAYIRTQITQLDASDPTVDIHAETTAFMARLAVLQARIEALKADNDVRIDADTSRFTYKMALLRAQLLALNRSAIINIEARIEAFQASIGRLASNIRSFGEVIGYSIGGAFTALLPMISPIIANIGALLGNLGVMIGLVGTQLTGLVFGVATAAAGAGGVLAMAIGNVKKLYDETTKLNAAQQEAKSAIDGIKTAYNDLVSKTEQPILAGITKGAQAASSMMQMLEPMFIRSSQAFDGLMQSFKQSLGTPPVQAFIEYLNTSAGPMLTTFGRAVGNLFQGLGSMMVAFAPITQHVADGFLNMANSFAQWAAKLSESKKFEAFSQYFQTNMPKITSMFGDAIVGVVNFFSAFGTSASGMMTYLVDLMARWREWTSTLSENQAFQNFLNYVSATAPGVMNLIGQLTTFLVNLGIGMAPLGAKLMELVNNFLQWSNALMQNHPLVAQVVAVMTTLFGAFMTIMPIILMFKSLFAGLGTALLGVIPKIVSLVTGIGGLATRVIAFLPSLTSLGTLFSGLATAALPMLTAAFAALTSPIGLAVTAIAAVGVAAVGLGMHFSQSSIQVQGWQSKVSEATAQAVGSFMNLNEQATLALNQLAWGGQAVTQQMATSLVGIYDQMGQQVLSEMQTDHAQQLSTMQAHFAQSNALTATEEAAIVAKIQEANAQKEASHQHSTETIKNIIQRAADENRAITEAEQQEINAIQETMKTNAVKYMSESEAEQKAILESLKAEASEITAQQAAEVVKNSVKQKTEVVKEAKDQYTQTVAEIVRQRDEMGTISAEQADKLIQEAQRQRDDTVAAAEETHASVVAEAQAQASEHVSQVDWETGEVKSKWQIMKQDVSSKMKELGSDIKRDWTDVFQTTKTIVTQMLSAVKTKFIEMKTAAVDKVTEIKTAVTNKFTEIKTAVTDKMAQVKEAVVSKWGEAQSFLSSIDLTSIGRNIMQGLFNGIAEVGKKVVAKAKSIASSVGGAIEGALSIHSPSRVTTYLGEMTGLGLANGIENMRGSVIQSATRVANAVISATRTALDTHSPSRITTAIGSDVTQGLANGIEDNSKAAEKAAAKAAVDALKAMQKAFNNEMKNLDLRLEAKTIDTDAYVAEAKALAKKYESVTNATATVNAKIVKASEKEMKAASTAFSKQLTVLEDAYKAGQKTVIEYGDGLTTLSKDFAHVEGAVEKLGVKFKAVENEIFKTKFDDVVAAYKNGELAVEQYIQVLELMGEKHGGVSDRMLKIDKELATARYELAKQTVADIVANEQMGATAQVAEIERIAAAYALGTKQREALDKEAANIKEDTHKRLSALSDEYLKKIQEAQQAESDGIKKLTDEYMSALTQRSNSIKSFAGIFDEVKQASDVSGRQLIDNLRGQVSTMKDWASNMQKLAARGVNDGLIAELQQLGPKSAPEIAALNTLTDAELKEYVALWQEKSNEAAEQAIRELEGMRKETDVQIAALRSETKVQLSKYESEWHTAIRGITDGTAAQFNAAAATMPAIGANIIQKLMDGVSSMEGSLMKQVSDIASSVSMTISNALASAQQAAQQAVSEAANAAAVEAAKAENAVAQAISGVGALQTQASAVGRSLASAISGGITDDLVTADVLGYTAHSTQAINKELAVSVKVEVDGNGGGATQKIENNITINGGDTANNNARAIKRLFVQQGLGMN